MEGSLNRCCRVRQEPPIVKTEAVKYDPASMTAAAAAAGTNGAASAPFVATESRTVGGAGPESPRSVASDDGTDVDGAPIGDYGVDYGVGGVAAGSTVVTTLMEQGEIISTQNITSKTRTVETVTVCPIPSSSAMTFFFDDRISWIVRLRVVPTLSCSF